MKSQYCFLMSYAWFAPSYLVEDTVVERSTLSSLVADNQPLFNTGRTNKKKYQRRWLAVRLLQRYSTNTNIHEDR